MFPSLAAGEGNLERCAERRATRVVSCSVRQFPRVLARLRGHPAEADQRNHQEEPADDGDERIVEPHPREAGAAVTRRPLPQTFDRAISNRVTGMTNKWSTARRSAGSMV